MNNQDIFDKALAAGVEYPYLERYQYDDWYTTTGKLYNLSLYTGTGVWDQRKWEMIIDLPFRKITPQIPDWIPDRISLSLSLSLSHTF